MDDELIRNLGTAKDPHSGSTSLTPSCNPISGPALVFALISAPVPTPALVLPSFNKLFKQFIKTYLKLQEPSRPPAERKQSFKAKVPDVYYKKSHMDCYHFCQQCKNYFETAGAIGVNQTLFAAFFLWVNISVC